MSYFYQLSLVIDQFINALAGGHRENSFSGRTAYLKENKSGLIGIYWKAYSKIIDFCLFPLHGRDYSNQKHQQETEMDFHQGNDFARFLLSLTFLPVLLVISVPLYILYFVGIRPTIPSGNQLVQNDLARIKRLVRRIELNAMADGKNPESMIPDNLLDDLLE